MGSPSYVRNDRAQSLGTSPPPHPKFPILVSHSLDRAEDAGVVRRPSPDGVLVPLLLGVVGLPAAGGEDVLVLLVPAPQHHLSQP